MLAETYNLVIYSVGGMHSLAQRVLRQLKPGEVLLLEGPLGSGKTTFVQGMARALGVTQWVTSPTFTVVAEYEVTKHTSVKRLVHVDLYRLSGEKAGLDPAVVGVLARLKEDEITVVEWADRLGRQASGKARRINFEYGASSGERLVGLDKGLV